MCSALECADCACADITIDVSTGEAGEEDNSAERTPPPPPSSTRSPSSSLQPQQAAQPKGRKGEAYPWCTLLVEEALQEEAQPAEELELECTVDTPGSEPGNLKDIHASLPGGHPEGFLRSEWQQRRRPRAEAHPAPHARGAWGTQQGGEPPGEQR